jgi:hypothetical protein
LFIWATVGLLIDGWHQFPKSAPDEQLWRSRHDLPQADGQEADAHFTRSLDSAA